MSAEILSAEIEPLSPHVGAGRGSEDMSTKFALTGINLTDSP
jgi:hypothetical protein